MVPNEGIIVNDAKVLMKSEMLRQIWALGETTAEAWERATFEALTKGNRREDVDWEFEDNQAGYYAWVRSFDGLVQELIDDGYVKVAFSKQGQEVLKPTNVDPQIDYSQAAYPSR